MAYHLSGKPFQQIKIFHQNCANHNNRRPNPMVCSLRPLQERYGYVWDEARQMVDRYLDDYNGLKTRATEALRAVASNENLRKVGGDVVDFVRRYPIPSLLIGLGIGYLLARRSER